MNYNKTIIQRSLVFKHVFEIFLFMRYSRRTFNYPKRIALSDPTHLISMADHVAIGVKTLRIDSRCSLEKQFTELINMNL